MTPLALKLVEDGYEVVAPFLRGYAPTALAPDGRYDIFALSDDLLGLLDALGWKTSHVVGHDWGAVISYVAAVRQPHRFTRVTALSVPPFAALKRHFYRSLRQKWQSKYILWFQFAGLSEASLKRRDYSAIDSLWSQWSPNWTIPQQYVNHAKQSLSRPGSLSAALKYYREARPGLSPFRRRVQSLLLSFPSCPVVCMVGARDGCIQADAFTDLEYPTHVIPNAGHFLPLEATQTVADLIREG